jgi:hypothetical protein
MAPPSSMTESRQVFVEQILIEVADGGVREGAGEFPQPHGQVESVARGQFRALPAFGDGPVLPVLAAEFGLDLAMLDDDRERHGLAPGWGQILCGICAGRNLGLVPVTALIVNFSSVYSIGKMVGAVRFELTTSCTPSKRATKLRYAPTGGTLRCGHAIYGAVSHIQQHSSQHERECRVPLYRAPCPTTSCSRK